jgi:hypothetical protein
MCLGWILIQTQADLTHAATAPILVRLGILPMAKTTMKKQLGPNRLWLAKN